MPSGAPVGSMPIVPSLAASLQCALLCAHHAKHQAADESSGVKTMKEARRLFAVCEHGMQVLTHSLDPTKASQGGGSLQAILVPNGSAEMRSIPVRAL